MHKNLLDHKNGCDQSAKVVHEEYEEGTRQARRLSSLQVSIFNTKTLPKLEGKTVSRPKIPASSGPRLQLR